MKEHVYQLIEILRVLAGLLKELLLLAKELLRVFLSIKDCLSPEQFKALVKAVLAWLEIQVEMAARKKKEKRLYMENVIDHLHISERTYYRKVAAGILKPRSWNGRDYFYESDLEEQLKESRRKGRL
ncbi:hypothetical protein SAMN05216436_110110 [bacterium A37T11]|nr:hypothetical protein SAMN05216436_110110 [bacterium A37T11]